MNSLLHRRLGKVESALKPAPVTPVRLLFQPLRGSTDEEPANYDSDLKEAQAIGAFVIVVTPLGTKEERGAARQSQDGGNVTPT